ncbi:hypothetical protein K490DRAFT_59888 [Saccharata proteae CBS 121410]|uniref:Uncharacterized protein n=1 Tax=Saccharata proteae CBS 121410 TaxID=1314787 RepID=A0A9P4HM04_9PEZI|nr:hypothetical protein K490DRAFT_59888 [Saccharata proteae CBS 121410]
MALSATASMFWGPSASISWIYVSRATNYIILTKSRLRLDMIPGVQNAHLLSSIWQAEQQERSAEDGDAVKGQRCTFKHLFELTSKHFVATDPRDGVFGIFGIPARDADPDNGVLFLEPDHRLALVRFYVKMFVKQGLMAGESI